MAMVPARDDPSSPEYALARQYTPLRNLVGGTFGRDDLYGQSVQEAKRQRALPAMSTPAPATPDRLAAATAAASGTESETAYTEPRNTRPLTHAELRPATTYEGGSSYLDRLRMENPNGPRREDLMAGAQQPGAGGVRRPNADARQYQPQPTALQYPSIAPIQAELAQTRELLREAYANSKNDLLAGMQAKRLERRYSNLLLEMQGITNYGSGQSNAETQRMNVNTVMPRARLEADTRMYGYDTEAESRRQSTAAVMRGQDITADTQRQDREQQFRLNVPKLSIQEAAIRALQGGDLETAREAMAAFEGRYPPAPTNMFVESRDTLPGQVPSSFNRQTGDKTTNSPSKAITPEALRRLASGASAIEPGPNGTFVVVRNGKPDWATPEEARAARGR